LQTQSVCAGFERLVPFGGASVRRPAVSFLSERR